jgi:hypothetical protein
MWERYLTSIRNISGSTQVHDRARRDTQGLSLTVKLESRHMTSSVFVRRKIQPQAKFFCLLIEIKFERTALVVQKKLQIKW